MLTFYKNLCAQVGKNVDPHLVADMEKEHAKTMEGLNAKLKDAEENLGDVEVKNALLAIADFYNETGDKDNALEAYEKAFAKTIGAGGKLDNLLTKIRIAIFFDDVKLSQKYIKEAYEQLDKGGDWERKNKLKVYEGIFKMTQKDFSAAANLLLDSVATFTSTEIVTFQDFVFYTVMTSLMGLERNVLKNKVVESPEILSVVHERAHVREFLFAYYECDYYNWSSEFVGVIDHIKRDRYLAANCTKVTKDLRLNAYKQFISSYKSVTIGNMAKTFGLTADFIDQEVFEFVSSGKLKCKVNLTKKKEDAIIETQELVGR